MFNSQRIRASIFGSRTFRSLLISKNLLFPLLLLLFATNTLQAQVILPVTEDAYVDYQSSNTNFGTAANLRLRYQTGPTRYDQTYLKFNMAALPAGTAASDIKAATLKFFVSSSTSGAGVFSYVYLACADWNEATIRYSNNPGGCGSAIPVPNSAFVAGQYVSIDVTQIFKSWIAGSNYGLALYPGSPSDIIFASKESVTNPPSIEVDLAIRSVNGANGLTGGGTSGDIVLGIADGGVTTPKLADGSVTTPKLADAAVTSTKISNGAVGNPQLADGSVSSNKIVGGAVNNLHLADSSVTGNKIAAGAVGTPQIVDAAITANKIALGAVNNSLLADGSVTTGKIADGSVSEAKLADSSVTNSKIAAGAVNTQTLADNAVLSNKIASGHVVKSLNNLTDSVSLVGGDNVTITANGNALTIAASGGSGSGPTINPLRLATGRWHSVNEAIPDIAVGNQPQSIAFDGQNVWVTNSAGFQQQGSVMKIRSSDGIIIGAFNVGLGSIDTLYDGNHIWVSNRDSNNIHKLRASDGSVVSVTTGLSGPHFMSYDGRYIWAANPGSDPNVNGSVAKIDATNGALVNTYSTLGRNPVWSLYDGSSIWASNQLSNTLIKLDPTTGAPQLAPFIVGSQPMGMAFDGTHIWVALHGEDRIAKVDPANGVVLATYDVGDGPYMIAFDGSDLWVTNLLGNTVSKVRRSDGQVIATSNVGSRPAGIGFDGVKIWVTNYFSATVSRR